MRSKKQKTKDIRLFFTKAAASQAGGAGASQAGGAGASDPGRAAASEPDGATGSKIFTRSKVKKENNGDPTDGHLHHFKVKYSRTDIYEYPTDCDQPRTVLEAIKSTDHYQKKMKKKCLDENIVIQLGKEDQKSIVATHFPCSCIQDGESLIITCESEKVEEALDQHDKTIHSRDKYSVFYIDTEGGLHTKQKKLFRSKAVKQFKYLCVYGEKGMTVEEALRRDGRFIDDLGSFALSDNSDRNSITGPTRVVDNLDKKEFKIRLPRNKRAKDEKQHRCESRPVLDVAQQRGISARTALEKGDSNINIEEIYTLLRQQFPGLKEWMESRFPADSYQNELKLRKEDFGKIQQSFSEVHRVRKLLELGRSVCKVVVQNAWEGTGFVLFDSFILTNAHLFKDCVEGEKLKEGIDVLVFFNYEDPEPHTDYYYFKLADSLINYRENDLDYAVLELNPDSQKPNQTPQTKKMKVPPGLLKRFGPMPQDGEACIIGHPAGGLKKMDPTFVIEKEKRRKVVDDHLRQYKDDRFIVHLIRDLIIDQGIENIMMGGNRAEQIVTYNTFMYHGSSGSPVFDAHGRVFGLHTAGFAYKLHSQKHSVIEFAQPLLTIFEHFVNKLKESGNEVLLKRVAKEANSNQYLKKILNPNATYTAEPADPDESTDSDESMDTA
ncbi:serine protease FAM111A-like isoform X2 [Micropterus dolomieu]|uniref:serine protease FAM111A-like isoform X2 n=1 Tax=Micropterus dolomieu TaxID=147949 RepID=UPI001E8E0E2A|nr:serine protease FAM111A-like isoform X2 [Micropterus dolomieu]